MNNNWTKQDIELVAKARQFAMIAHLGQKDDEGQDYFKVHVRKVALMVKHLTNDANVISAAYLHDVIEDAEVSEEKLRKEFGNKITDLVMELTHEGVADEHGYYFPRLKSAEAIMIKMIDRASNISRMNAWSDKRKAHYLKNSKFWKSE